MSELPAKIGPSVASSPLVLTVNLSAPADQSRATPSVAYQTQRAPPAPDSTKDPTLRLENEKPPVGPPLCTSCPSTCSVRFASTFAPMATLPAALMLSRAVLSPTASESPA